MSDTENKVGRPPMYKTPEEMQKAIDKYFEDCNGEYITDEEGNLKEIKYIG